MRRIGHSTPIIRTVPGAQALREAAVHQTTGSALTAINTMGMTKGVYCFKTHEQANAHADEALLRAIALNVAARRATVPHK